MTGFDAIGAHHDLPDLAVANRPDTLQIGIKSSFGQVVRMTDIIADQRFFPAYFTLF